MWIEAVKPVLEFFVVMVVAGSPVGVIMDPAHPLTLGACQRNVEIQELLVRQQEIDAKFFCVAREVVAPKVRT